MDDVKAQIERRLQDLFGDRLIRVVWGAEKDDLLEGTVMTCGDFSLRDMLDVGKVTSDFIEASEYTVTVDLSLETASHGELTT